MTAPLSPDEGVRAALEALGENCWSLVCQDYPTAGGDDADVGYEVVSSHMSHPKTRIEGAGPTPLIALQQAGLLASLSNPVPEEGLPRGSASAAEGTLLTWVGNEANDDDLTAEPNPYHKYVVRHLGGGQFDVILYTDTGNIWFREHHRGRNIQASYEEAKAFAEADFRKRVVVPAQASDGVAAALPSPLPSQEEPVDDEDYEIGKRDGYEQAVQDVDLMTGGDGEYRYVLGFDDGRHCPDAATMKARIADRFEALSTEAAGTIAAARKQAAEEMRERAAKVAEERAEELHRYHADTGVIIFGMVGKEVKDVAAAIRSLPSTKGLAAARLPTIADPVKEGGQ